MKICICVAVFSVCVLSAQTPNLSGVWKANLEKSKLSGPPPTNYLVIIDQQGSKLTVTVGNFGRMGEQRSSFTYNTTDEKPSRNSFRGLPMQTKASWDSGALVLDSKVAGAHAASMHEKYVLSADGNTLTVTTVTTVDGKENQQTL